LLQPAIDLGLEANGAKLSLDWQALIAFSTTNELIVQAENAVERCTLLIAPF